MNHEESGIFEEEPLWETPFVDDEVTTAWEAIAIDAELDPETGVWRLKNDL